MLLQGLLKYILYTSRYPSIGFICLPTSGVKGVAALYEAFQVGGGGGGGGGGGRWGVCCHFTGLF